MKNNPDLETVLDAISNKNPRDITQLINSGKYNEVILREKDTIIKKLDNIMQRFQALPEQSRQEFSFEITNMFLIQEDFLKFYKEQENKQSKVATASVQASTPPITETPKPLSLPQTEPRPNELSNDNSPEEKTLRAAIRSLDLNKVKSIVNNPNHQSLLMDKKSQIFQTISYAKMDLWSNDQLLPRAQKMQYDNDFDSIRNSISSKTQEIEKAIAEANRKPSLLERTTNFLSEIIQTIKSIFPGKSEKISLDRQPSVEAPQKVSLQNVQQNQAINKQILNDATKLATNVSAKTEDVQNIPNSASVNTSKSAAQNTEQAR